MLFKLIFSSIHVQTTRSLTHCGLLCSVYRNCMSFFYARSTRECRLHSVVFFNTTEGVQENGWRYYIAYNDNCQYSDDYYINRELNICFKIRRSVTGYIYLYEQACQTESTDLLKVDTAQKHTFFQSFLAHIHIPYTPFVIQGTLVNSVWTYSDGSNMSYFNWGDQQPNGRSGETRIALWTVDKYLMHDTFYYRSYLIDWMFICEKQL